MSKIWVFKSHQFNMFVDAKDYQEACALFKKLLIKHIINNPTPTFDELIEISCIHPDGIINDINSHIEFTEIWLKELGVTVDTYHLID